MIVHDSWWSNGSTRSNYHGLSSTIMGRLTKALVMYRALQLQCVELRLLIKRVKDFQFVVCLHIHPFAGNTINSKFFIMNKCFNTIHLSIRYFLLPLNLKKLGQQRLSYARIERTGFCLLVNNFGTSNSKENLVAPHSWDVKMKYFRR